MIRFYTYFALTQEIKNLLGREKGKAGQSEKENEPNREY